MKLNTSTQNSSPGLKIAIIALTTACSVLQVNAQDAPGDGALNLAAGAALTAEGTTGDAGVNQANLNDGNAFSFWKGTAPSSVTIDLGSSKPVGAVVLQIPGQYATPRTQEISVEVSEDGSSYKVVSERAAKVFTATAQNTVRIPVTGRARFVKVNLFSNDKDDGNVLLSEIKILE